jgi:Uma2 family endonuclease
LRQYLHERSKSWRTLDRGINVRLGQGKRVIPDLIVGGWDRDTKIVEVADVLLIGEVTSPGRANWDREEKRSHYAAARIPWYLLVDPRLPGP